MMNYRKLNAILLTWTMLGFPAMIGCSLVEPHGASVVAPVASHPLDSSLTPISTIEAYFRNQTSDVAVTVKGVVIRILSDDTIGDQHQRFIIRLANAQTLLIAHNIDVASRVSGISIDSSVYVHGDYVWSSEGGLIHWTHHDPAGVHEGGWIVFGGTKYE